MFKKALHIALLLTLTACGGMLQSSWTNFRAYHNTYYNAKHFYRSGLSQIERQPVEIDPRSPVRIVPLPSVAGEADFENAIARGNRILRDFPESKWADEAMEIIGKSHYYMHAFYPALWQFEELYEQTEDPELKQKAIVWKGRVLFDLGAHEEGIVFLENELNRPEEWGTKLKSETELILAEYHVQLGNREEAVSVLRQALNGTEKGEMRARAFFLLGQLLEMMERYSEAEYAYSMTLENLPEFDLLYLANMRKAGVLRKRENREGALQIYRMMTRDDKYLERMPHISYEIARTEEGRGNHLQAEQIYQEVLRSPPGSLEPALLADAYYRLGRMHADVYEQFQLAAAYFDSAAAGPDEISTGLFAKILETNGKAGVWREYSLLRQQLSVVDSLLWLGSLSGEDRDAAVSEIIESDPQSMDQEDWNRADILLNEESPETEQEAGLLRITLNLERIPASVAERQELKNEQASIRYTLGSLLMLTLDQPGDAVSYLRLVVEEHPNHEMVPAALYALFDIYFSRGEVAEARIWSSRLRRSYPETVYTERLNERLGSSMESLLYNPD